jgi:hypothetical protein
MRTGKSLTVFFLWAVAAVFVYGVIELLILRFERGDLYPPYSSFRPDPLGTKALYEGLRGVKGIETGRNIEPLDRVTELSRTTLFLFGLQPSQFRVMAQSTVKAVEEAAERGGRIVISFASTDNPAHPPSNEERPEEESKEGGADRRDEEQRLAGEADFDLGERWNVATGFSAEEEAEADFSAPEKDFPSPLTWYGALFFEPRDHAWRVLYTRAGKAVLMERSYGRGSIVLASDSFFLSNEAMKKGRHPRLLSWLCGTHRRILFDETHLGVSRNPGVATLIRKYGLAPFFLSLIALTLLAVWKQSARFVPPCREDDQRGIDAGKDAFMGLTNLLRRNIAPDDVLTVCLEEWKRSFSCGGRSRSALLPRIEEIIASDRAGSRKNRNPVRAYSQISRLETRQPLTRRFDGQDVESAQ